jgi:hypothetical protein
MSYRKTTAQDYEDWGDDGVSSMTRIAQDANAGEIGQLRQQVAGLQSALASTTRRNVLSEMRRRVPRFDEINNDNEFIRALQAIEPLSGMKYQALLTEAWHNGDVDRAARFFTDWEADQKRQPYRGETHRGQIDGLRYPGPGPQGRIITRAEIQKHHDDIVRGRYEGRDNARKAMDQAICDASREGRIQ